MVSIPQKTSIEFIDGLLDVLQKVKETLVAARSFVLTNDDMIADGGDPFDVIEKDCSDDQWQKSVDKYVSSHNSHNQTVDNSVVDTDEEVDNTKVSDVVSEVESVVRKKRAKVTHRASVTPELNQQIISAIRDRTPRPRMVDVAREFNVSQSTVSRLWGINQSPLNSRSTPLEGQTVVPFDTSVLPIVSEGTKPEVEE